MGSAYLLERAVCLLQSMGFGQHRLQLIIQANLLLPEHSQLCFHRVDAILLLLDVLYTCIVGDE